MSLDNEPLTGSSQLIAEQLVRFGPQSRSELARRVDLSRASLTRLTKPLLDAGLLVDRGEEQQARTGRPARLLDVVDDAHSFVGVNLTGDAAFGVVTDLRSNVRRSAVVDLDDRSPDQVLDRVADLVDSLRADDLLGVGVSLGGLVQDRSVVVRAPFLGWHDPFEFSRPLADRVATHVVVDNDLLALTRGEQWFGIGRDHDHFAVLTIGAGVGFGLVVHDRIVDSPDAGLGLVADLPLDPLGPRCPAGHRGCGNAMLTIGAIRRQVSLALGGDPSWTEVLDLARHGDPAVSTIIADAGRALGRLVAIIANVAMPRVVVLSGEGVDLADVAADHVAEGIADAREVRAAPIDLRPRDHDFHAWARGAAAAAIQAYVDDRITASLKPTTLSA